MLIQEICSVMKNIIAALLLSTLSGCSTNSTEEKDEPQVVIADTVYEKVNDAVTDTSRVIKNAPATWSADFEEATNTYKIHNLQIQSWIHYQHKTLCPYSTRILFMFIL